MSDERRERYADEASAWYEVINPRNATTSIALVHDDGELYLPEGPGALTVEEFHFAAAQGKAYRLIRVDEAMAVADEEHDDLRRALRFESAKVGEQMTENIHQLMENGRLRAELAATQRAKRENDERFQLEAGHWRESARSAEATIARVRAVISGEYSDDPYAQFLAAAIRAALDGEQ